MEVDKVKPKKEKKPFFRKDKKKAAPDDTSDTTNKKREDDAAAAAKKKQKRKDGGVDEASKAVKKAPKRKKEKDKAKKKAALENHVHETVGQSKALRYLENWSEERGNWKFEKCRQIWLLQNCYELNKVSDQKFDILLEYMGTIKGKMKDMALGGWVLNCHYYQLYTEDLGSSRR